MKQLHLRKKFLNTKRGINGKAQYKQHNYCVTLIRKAEQTFFDHISTTDVTDNKTFWKTVKKIFTDKVTTCSKITSIEKKEVQKKDREKVMIEKVISNDYDISDISL